MTAFNDHERVGCCKTGCFFAQPELLADRGAALAPEVDGGFYFGEGNQALHTCIVPEYRLDFLANSDIRTKVVSLAR